MLYRSLLISLNLLKSQRLKLNRILNLQKTFNENDKGLLLLVAPILHQILLEVIAGLQVAILHQEMEAVRIVLLKVLLNLVKQNESKKRRENS